MAKVSIRLSEDPEAHTWSVEEEVSEDKWKSMLTTPDVVAAVLMMNGIFVRDAHITSTNAIVAALERIAETQERLAQAMWARK